MGRRMEWRLGRQRLEAQARESGGSGQGSAIDQVAFEGCFLGLTAEVWSLDYSDQHVEPSSFCGIT